MKNKGLYKLLGFTLFIFGFTSLVLQMVGVQWAFLTFLEIPGRLFAFIFKIFMVLAGLILVVVANTDWENERKESLEK